MSRAEINQDPMEREFFDDEPINTRLVRETIQNSLDAGLARASGDYSESAEPVRVRFSFAGIHNPLPAQLAAKYFVGLAPHLDALPEADDAIGLLAAHGDLAHNGAPFIVIEDVGTVGLEGDWEQFDDNESQPADNNHFYWFFRNVGRSGKSDSDNGSWGLGKWVFPDASHASAYIAVSRRRSDDETLLIGQSVLTKHTIQGQRYAPYGYFAIPGVEEMAIPLRHGEPAHRSFVNQCIADFGLQYRNHPGLSVIIPFPRTDDVEQRIDTPKILASVVHNYFYSIINRRLEVTVDEGDGSPPVEINADTIDAVLDNADLEYAGERSVDGYRRVFDMCRKAAELTDSDYIDMTVSELQELGDESSGISTLRHRYNSYELLAFRIATDVQRKGGARENTEFRFYVQRDDSLSEGHDYYVRGTLSISEMNFIGQTRARSLLVVSEREQLAAMLRDSEPPAHTLWRPQAHRVTDHWVAPLRRINAVRHAPRTLLRAMEVQTEELQKDAFADIFFYERPGSQPTRRPTRRVTPPIVRPPSPSSRDFDVQNTNSGTGFRMRMVNGSQSSPVYARLRVAYEVPRGNPLKSYSPMDFRLHGADALNVQTQGCQVISPPQDTGRAGNELFLQIDDPSQFALMVQGFDPNRDVYVRVEKMADEAFSMEDEGV